MWWQTSDCSSLLIYRERLSWPGWLTYSGRLTHVNGHPSATGRAQDGERTLARDWRSTADPRGPTISIISLHAELLFSLLCSTLQFTHSCISHVAVKSITELVRMKN